MPLLKDKVCIITGASGSIGLAGATRLYQEGAKIMLVDLDLAKLEQAGESIGEDEDRIALMAADVSSTEQTLNYINATVAKWGKIDVFFINAGISGLMCPIVDYPEEIFDAVMKVNVRSAFLGCKYGLPQMNDNGSIIITSSIMGVQSDPNICAYTTSKHAVVGLMRCAAKEAAPRNIRVNILAPGPVHNSFQTDIEDRLSKVIGINATEMINNGIPLKRHARAEEIANTLLFLASDQSSFSTGSIFMADGGLNA